MKPTKLTTERKLMLRSLDNELSALDKQQLEGYLKMNPVLRSEYDDLKSVRNVLSYAGKPSFSPYFTDRVMKRVFSQSMQESSDYLFKQLTHLFLRFAFVASVVAVLLGAYNVMSNRDLSNNDSIIKNVFSLPDASITSVAQNTNIISYQDIKDDNSN